MPAWSESFLGVWSLGALLFAVALPLPGQSDRNYVGEEACTKCHATIHREWAESLHSKMLQPATEKSVKGDFAQGKLVLRGSSYFLQRRSGKYYITASYLAGKPWQQRVEYTLGNRRIQHYLTTLPDGRIILIPATWDIVRKKWVDDADIENPEEPSGVSIQVWNKSCYSCHVSGEEKNFDLQHLRYHTRWQNFGINCERCHGPGSEHVARAASAKVMDADTGAMVKSTIVNPARLDPTRSTMICAQCHSFRDIYADGFAAGGNYYDFFQPVMEYRLPASEGSVYWPDGRPRWLSNETLGLWQSQCFLKGGATCITCHSQPHKIDIDRNPQLRPDNQALCGQCHTAIAANISEHSHHAPKSSGSSCVECHMPATVISLRARMRDHAMSAPVPENTMRHGIPNACNLCHRDRDGEWALRQMKAWYGDQSRQKLMRRADAFSEARQGDAAAIPALLQILSDPAEGPLIRANAAGYLGSFPNDPAAYDAVFGAFSDPEALVRATAASALRPRAAQRAAAAPALASLLQDPVRTVQMSAAITLVAMGVRQLPGEEGERLERAKQLYRARAELDSDDAEQQLAAGKFFFLAGDMDPAVAAFRASLKLDPKIPAQYYLARALAEKRDFQSARQILKTIPPNDPQYASAQRLLAVIEVSDQHGETLPKSATAQNSAEAEARFGDGQLLYQNENYGGALKQLEEALRLAPEAPWAAKAQIYRAICLEKLARTREAEAALQALSGNAAARQDVDLQLALVELLYETGRWQEALKRIDQVIAAVPKAPMAYFWRARLLLQLHRTEEAASAAEESIRLLPDLPVAHNLLIRIYQLQGRAGEAAQQAEWLRDYQRRMESR